MYCFELHYILKMLNICEHKLGSGSDKHENVEGLGAWGGWGWELGGFDFFMASPTTLSLSSSFSFPTNRLGQEVQDSTSGELPMVSCMCTGCPVRMSGRCPNALVCPNAGNHLQKR